MAAPEVVVRFTLKGAGQLPSVYRSAWLGNGVLVLGLLPSKSFTPGPVTREDSGFQNTVETDRDPGIPYGYLGNNFRDDQGHEYIILIKL